MVHPTPKTLNPKPGTETFIPKLEPRSPKLFTSQIHPYPFTPHQVTVNGYNFGTSAPESAELALSFGAAPCADVTWTSDSQVVCRTTPGVGQV